MQPYVGKWIKVSGKVGDVRRFDSEWVVTLERANNHLPVMLLRFRDQKSIAQVETMHRGHAVIAIGQIDDVDALGVTLRSCELVLDGE
jgi:hypothetical protein